MQRKQHAPIRVLHVVGGMNAGGIETWLMHVLRHIDRAQLHMDFLVHTSDPGSYDAEIRALGSKVLPCLTPTRPWAYAQNLQRLLREHGPYHVVHSHVHDYSGYVLWLAKQAGVPGRIAHSHNDTTALDIQASQVRRSYLALMRKSIAQTATLGFAASNEAATSLFGSGWQHDGRWRVLHCGIDLAPFHERVDGAKLRAELGVPPDAFVVGHVGRFAPQKNHQLLVEIAAEVCRREPRAYFVLVGQGELQPAVKHQVQARGLADQVVFTGARSDVQRLMSGLFDLFVLPSLHEGLPIVGIEAQAAGLPCVFSNTITTELDVHHGLIRRLALTDSAACWAEAMLALRASSTPAARHDALAALERSSFNIHRGVERLMAYYAA